MIKFGMHGVWRTAGAAAVALLALTGGTRSAGAQDFVVGVIGSLTGPAASFDLAVVEGVQAAIKHWNDNGGFNGRKVVVNLQDDESVAATAVTVYRKLVDDPKINIVIGASPAQSLIAIKAVADEFKTPTVGSATLDTLGKPAAKYFFRTLPSTESYMQTLMAWIKQRGYKTIAIMNPSDVTGQAEASILQRLAAEAGVRIAAAEKYNNTDTSFTAQLVNIRNSNPDFFYAGAIGGPAVQIFKSVKQLQLTMPLALHSTFVNPAFFTGIGGIEQAEGVYTPIERGGMGATAAGEPGELYKAASAIMGHPATSLNTAGFDTGLLVHRVVNKTDGTREGIRNALEATKDLPMIGGFISYSVDDHSGKDSRAVAVGQLIKGQIVEAK
jgi:branched-chain amino acid transport system substrate-binding protein